MEDVRIELLRELGEILVKVTPKDFEPNIRYLTISDIEEYIDELEGALSTLASCFKIKRVELENSAIAKEALSRVR